MCWSIDYWLQFSYEKTGCFLWWWQKTKSLLLFCSFSAEMDLGTSSQNGAEMAEEQLSILTCPAVVEFQCTLYPKGLFTRGALVSVLTVHLRITNRKSQVTSDRQILNLKYLICFLSFPFFKRAFNYTVVQNPDAVSSCHLSYKKKKPQRKTMLLCGCSSLPDIPLVQHTHRECLRSKMWFDSSSRRGGSNLRGKDPGAKQQWKFSLMRCHYRRV